MRHDVATARVGLLLVSAVWLTLLFGCKNQELERLRAENMRLRAALEDREPGSPANPETIDEITVGLAASEKDFDEQAFLELIRRSLQDAAIGGTRFTIEPERDEQQIAKVRGMLVQQHLGEQEIPIRVTNLTFKLKDPASKFKIGGTVVPRDEVAGERTTDGLTRFTCSGPLLATMNRDGPGSYSIAYEDSDGGSGRIQLPLPDVEVLSAEDTPKFARQGDISLNWELSLEKIQVYRVSDFVGDLGKFMRRMRYPTVQTNLNQYQTIRDAVYLVGYGPYRTGLVSRMETPAFIDQVEVLPITATAFDRINPGIAREELDSLIRESASKWIACEFAEQNGDRKIWERPSSVQFPFLSRERSADKELVFYTKHGQDGSLLVGDFRIRGN